VKARKKFELFKTFCGGIRNDQRIKKILATQPTLEIILEITRAAVTTAGSGKIVLLAYRG
jgi:hypothetical protein